MPNHQTIQVLYFSDILCVWAYIAQRRLDELKSHFKDQIKVEYDFIPLFGAVQKKIHSAWDHRGGFQAYHDHVIKAAEPFPHIQIHPKTWLENIPASSANIHLVIKALQALESQREIDFSVQENGSTLIEEFIWKVRINFFQNNINIGLQKELLNILEQLSLPCDKVLQMIENGEAYALLCEDMKKQEQWSVKGSPTFVLNEGRQILYGNVGYRVLEANISELLENHPNQASWC